MGIIGAVSSAKNVKKKKAPFDNLDIRGQGFSSSVTSDTPVVQPKTDFTPPPLTKDQQNRLDKIGNIEQFNEFQKRQIAEGTLGSQTYQVNNTKLSPEEFNVARGALGSRDTGGVLTPAVSAAVEDARKTQEEKQNEAALIAQGEQPVSGRNERIGIDELGKGSLTENLTTAGAAIGGGILGAKTGAAIGTLGGPVGTVIGAVGGAIVGAVGGAFTKVSYQKRQNVKEAFKTYNAAKSNQAWILNQVNTKKLSPITARGMWDNEKLNLFAAERHLKQQTTNDLNKFLSNAGDELITVQSYMARQAFLDVMFEDAVSNPDPSKLIMEQPEAFSNE